MNFFKRATLTIRRQLGKSAILFLLIFVLSMVLSGAISIRNAIFSTTDSLMMRTPALAIIEFNIIGAAEDTGSELWEFGRGYQMANQPTIEEISAVGNLPDVRTYDFFLRSTLFSRDLQWAEIEIDEDSLPIGTSLNYLARSIQGAQSSGGYIELFQARGVNRPEITDIGAGLITLVSGRTFIQEEIDNDARVVIISQAFADINDLSIGSTIELENIAHDYTTMGFEGSGNFALDRHDERFILAHQMLEFEVVGIFDVAQEFVYDAHEEWQLSGALHDRALLNNRFYIPIGIAESALNFVAEAMLDIEGELREIFGDSQADELIDEEPLFESIFVLYDPRDLNAFSTAATELLPGFWEVRDLTTLVSSTISSMDSVLQIANFIEWITIGSSIIILTLVILLFLHERRHEIGIYRALGAKKSRIIMQFLTEVGLIAIVAITLALFAGNLISEFISRQMIEEHLTGQIQESDHEVDIIPWELALFNPGAMTIEETMELYNVALSIRAVLTFALMGGATILFSVVVPIIYVTKLKPKKILM